MGAWLCGYFVRALNQAVKRNAVPREIESIRSQFVILETTTRYDDERGKHTKSRASSRRYFLRMTSGPLPAAFS